MHARTPLQTQLRVGGTPRGGQRCLLVPHTALPRDFAKTYYSHICAFAIKKPKQATSATSSSIESIGLLQRDVELAIDEAIVCSGPRSVITETDLGPPISDVLKALGKSDDVRVVKYKGKVRDTYQIVDPESNSSTNLLVIVTTDRQSAFDRHLASIPFKGQVLNKTSAWWMSATSHMVPNALISTPHPNVSIMKNCNVFPVEFVVRGFMTGSTDTSLWTHYKAGEREYCGNYFPDGMRKNDRLTHNVITPTTKAKDHDEPIAPADILARGLMSKEHWEAASSAALSLFEYGQKEAAKKGLLLVDTKYEFGVNPEDGSIMLVDEIHTPDSSRYWLAETYEERHAVGQEPQNIDKEFLRLWFRANCDPYKDAMLPEAPAELVAELSRRYITLYEMITGERFIPETRDMVSDVVTGLKAVVGKVG